MDSSLEAFAIGVVTGIVVVGVTVYITAPAIAERATIRAVKRQGSSLLGVTLPQELVDPVAVRLGAIVRSEVKKVLVP
jgi:hypothetical protein